LDVSIRQEVDLENVLLRSERGTRASIHSQPGKREDRVTGKLTYTPPVAKTLLPCLPCLS